MKTFNDLLGKFCVTASNANSINSPNRILTTDLETFSRNPLAKEIMYFDTQAKAQKWIDTKWSELGVESKAAVKVRDAKDVVKFGYRVLALNEISKDQGPFFYKEQIYSDKGECQYYSEHVKVRVADNKGALKRSILTLDRKMTKVNAYRDELIAKIESLGYKYNDLVAEINAQ